MPIKIAMVVFPEITQLDATGPCEVFASLPNVELHLVGGAPVSLGWGLTLNPSHSFATHSQFDIVCVPGGTGVNKLMEDEVCLGFLRSQARGAQFMTSVCTGALVLGAAGLLRGYRATTHWQSLPFLKQFGAVAVEERVVFDRDRITGGGVTAGIDFALSLAATIEGEPFAQRLQLALEYDPKPPFASGSPRMAQPEVVAAARENAKARQDARTLSVQRAAAKLLQQP